MKKLLNWIKKFICKCNENQKPFHIFKIDTFDELSLLNIGDNVKVKCEFVDHINSNIFFEGKVSNIDYLNKRIVFTDTLINKTHTLDYLSINPKLEIDKTKIGNRIFTIWKIVFNQQMYINHFDII